MKKIIVNGEMLDETSNIAGVNNRGLKFADGIFETIRVENSIPYMWNEHINRLKEGLRIIGIKDDIDDLYQQSIALLNENKYKDAVIRIMVVRGGESIGYLPSNVLKPMVIIQTTDLPEYNDEMSNLWIGSHKKIPSECLPQNVKYNQAMHSILSKVEADENKCFESLILNLDGSISETSSGNIFWVKGGIIYTPSKDCNILPGTIREKILCLFSSRVKEGKFYLEDIKNADEVFITNSIWKIRKICSIEPVGYDYHENTQSNEILRAIEEDIINYEIS